MPKRPTSVARFDVAVVRAAAGSAVFKRGAQYHADGKVEILSIAPSRVVARVVGSDAYRTVLTGGPLDFAGECTCRAFADSDFCKHLVATALAANQVSPEAAATAAGLFDKIRAHLRARGIDNLVAMIMQMAERDSRLLRELELAAASDDGDDEALHKQLRKAVTAATRVDRYIGYREVGGWVSGIAEVLDNIERLVEAGRAPVVLRLMDHVFDRLEGGFETVDDSDGQIGEQFTRACDIHLAACRKSPPEPIALAGALFDREVGSDWDFFAGASETYADVLGDVGRAEYRRLAEAAWNRVKPLRPGVAPTGKDQGNRRRLAEILDDFAKRDGDFDARLAIRAKTLGTAYDYLGLVDLCVEHGRHAEALKWAEEGLWQFESKPDERLVQRAAELRRRAGRAVEADDLLWQSFARQPDLAVYRRLKSGLRGDAARAVTDKVVALLRERAAADLLVDLFIGEKRLAEAWDAARTYRCSSYKRQALAQASETQHPAEALATYAELVETAAARTSNDGYAEAGKLIERMRRIREQQGQRAAHAAYLQDLMQRHKMKRNFIKLLRPGAPSAGA